MNGNIKTKKKYYLGYTLIELLVVIALIGILSAICIPNMKALGKSNEKEEIIAFKRDIFDIKNKAIIEAVAYTLKIEKTDNSYSIFISGNLIKKVQFKSWEIQSGNNFNNSIRFFPHGSPDRGGSIRLKNQKGNIVEITVTPVTGKINVYKTKN